MNRYTPQMKLPEIREHGQSRLRRARVLVVGAGGLGCPALSYLTGAGVGRITIYDPDHVDESNLHRQVLYQMGDLGRPKALAARNRLLTVNPEVRVDAHRVALTPANVAEAVCQADLVIDAADNLAISYTLSDTCQPSGTPLISASAQGQRGYVGGFCGAAPSLRAVFPEPPQTGANCATAGVLGPIVGVVGAMQAHMALQVLIQQDPSPLGRLISIDAQTWHIGGFSFCDAPEPANAFPFLSAEDLSSLDQVIELRPAAEAPTPAVPQAIRIPVDEIATLNTRVDRRVVLCCSTGLRAWRAAIDLRARGFDNLALLASGPAA